MKPTTREFTAGIVLLWALLTGFFWTGYWVGGQEQLQRNAANVSNSPPPEPAAPRTGTGRSDHPEAPDQAPKLEPPARL